MDAEQSLLTVRKEDGRFLTYDPARLSGVTVYEPEQRAFAVGDRVQFTTPWRDKAISTREVGTITHLDPDGNIRVTLDGSKQSVGWNLNQNKQLDYAYAMTSYSSQGATVDRVLVQIDTTDTRTRSLVNETLAYVALSRPQYVAQIFTGNAEQLGKALTRTNQNTTALAQDEIRSYAMAV